MKKKYNFERNSGTDVNIVAKKKKNKKFNFFPKLLCLVCALLIWLYVMYLNKNDYEIVLENIPIELRGEEEIRDNYGLEIVDEGKFSVNITVRGKKNVIDKLTAGNVKAYVYVANISDAEEKMVEIRYEIPDFKFMTYRTNKNEVRVKTQWVENNESGNTDAEAKNDSPENKG